MNCELSEETLSAYADGELDPRERGAADAHLSGCSRCSEQVAVLKGLKASIRKSPQPAIPEDLKALLLAEARRVDSKLSRRRSSAGIDSVRRVLSILRAWLSPKEILVGAAALGAVCLVLVVSDLVPGTSGAAQESVPLEVMLSAHSDFARSVRDRSRVGAPVPDGSDDLEVFEIGNDL